MYHATLPRAQDKVSAADTASRPSSNKTAIRPDPEAEGEAESASNKPIKVEQLPFIRLPIASTGVVDILPRPAKLEKLLEATKAETPQEVITELAREFERINSTAENKDFESEMENWRTRVLSGFDNSLVDISRVAYGLLNVMNNKALAFGLFKVAADKGQPFAAFFYATFLANRSVQHKQPRLNRVSKDIIRELAYAGKPEAMVVYADVLLALGEASATKKAVAFLEKASTENNSGMAALRLGNVYRKGHRGVPVDLRQAGKWFMRAGDLGVGEGYYMMGNIYSMEVAGKQPDFTKAFELFEKAAGKNVAEAQYNVGLYYLEGKGVRKSATLAMEYWSMATANRFPVAALNLGKMLIEGKDVERNYRRAREVLAVAIDASGPDGFIREQAEDLLSKIK
ncbi:hypothetical protein GGI07_005130 [Coemansia sp. Benny D115]|nr:hypothetical protein GGI07_005130 [Coemansia sp. Benny D115]